ncbi:beta galactosidase jelly roll domain-containing protein [Ancylomarina longa]|uniref:Glycoside hydrolase n=1 Tax=Ancylomarina longa TaxID=2487017 RepID=A0A434AX86_9BACT|nr:beta galactosidase jelly roll domain-containing protein [Ancylomarina longa]RUT79141.1 glycoside hydrolase [Ancylomarina longa]
MRILNTYINPWIKASLLFAIVCIFTGSGFSQDYKKITDLNERWKFSIGDRQEWASPKFDDSGWDRIEVPSAWENQGFYGYNGYAWYRNSFTRPSVVKGKSVYLQLGNIDDVDEVFFNGKIIGKSGNFPPHYTTAYNSNRLYYVPTKLIQDRNTIAVRVYDDIGEGGIIHGDIALVIDRAAIPLDVDLQGIWKFKTGKYAHEDVADMATWNDIIVPGFWEDQGYKNYDGYACYALEFKVKNEQLANRMVLLLGKIDDIDQVFVNGVLVGESGPFRPSTVAQRSSSYKQMRGYYLPLSLIKANQKNIVMVRVYDQTQGGGIYSGSVGLISQKNYIRYWNNRRNKY